MSAARKLEIVSSNQSVALQQHPLSAIFPSIPDAELTQLSDDIKANGLRYLISLYEGKVLDGWNRYKACLWADVEPKTKEYSGGDPVAFVRSMNAHRRHLSVSQRAFAEIQLNEWQKGPTRGKAAPMADLQGGGAPGAPLATVAEMAQNAGTGERSIQQAKVVEEKGSDALKEAVKEGEISLKKAAVVAAKPKAQQAQAMKEKPAPKVIAPPAKEEDFGDQDWQKEFIRTSAELNKAHTLIEALQKDDLAKEVASWSLKFDQLDGRLQLAVTQKNEAEKDAKYAQGYLAKIRKELGVEKNAEIIGAIQDLKR